MVDNFELLGKLLEFRDNNSFYYVLIIKRKKDHPELGAKSRVVMSYYIRSEKELIDRKEEITMLCKWHKARAYIHLNPRNFRRVAFATLKILTECILNEEYKLARKAFNRACGRWKDRNSKLWIVDIDGENTYKVSEVLDIIKELKPNPGTYKDYFCVPTKNGFHAITSKFDLEAFKRICPKVAVHKNNPTVLYIP